MDMLDRPLFVGAHTDDIELFAGGLLAQRRKTARALTFSSHRGITDHEQAKREHLGVMARLGVPAHVEDMTACSGAFQTQRERIYHGVLLAVQAHQATCVITHPLSDTNQDHQQVTAEVIRACKGLVSVVTGEYPFNEVGGDLPNMLVELTEGEVESKIVAVRAYESQYASHRHYFRPEAWRGLAAMRGAQIGAQYAEGFHIIRAIVRKN